MIIKESTNQAYARTLGTTELRSEYLFKDLFVPGSLHLVYTHEDRVIIGGAVPIEEELEIQIGSEIGVSYFLERRELGCFNIGGSGMVKADDRVISMETHDAVYVPKGTQTVRFSSLDTANPAKFYFISTPAHVKHALKKISIEEAPSVNLGNQASGNVRTIYQFIHPDVLETCQLSMGLTMLAPGSLWNTMPPHSHGRRMEVYLYFGLQRDQVVFHIMGPPEETRHLVVRNEQAVLSPSWSIHSGVGTSNYYFIWAMAGENRTFTDMDHISVDSLK